MNTAIEKLKVLDAESQRLLEDGNREKNWKRWGPYLAERQWGTVREDYSEYGIAGSIFRTITRARARTDGARTDCWDSPIARRASASRSRFGTAATRSSRSASSVSRIPRAITVRT